MGTGRSVQVHRCTLVPAHCGLRVSLQIYNEVLPEYRTDHMHSDSTAVQRCVAERRQDSTVSDGTTQPLLGQG